MAVRDLSKELEEIKKELGPDLEYLNELIEILKEIGPIEIGEQWGDLITIRDTPKLPPSPT